ncbi:hypothetical protein A3L09_10610 (plasmid) [Thermococcus profundus]|uniref:Uncharacterized protein n=1 Tax=Thermococcus profundus TaxID=49899 RepID=A0A2Z2MGC9_THEPR|nr:hypothetical protein [Thermococcus profundus]ASJ03802.1 hypothetical protein A3L09_10610 [Thermococcus profundus]
MSATETIIKDFSENRNLIKKIFKTLFPEGWVEVSVLRRGDYDPKKHEFRVRGRYSRYFNLSRRGAAMGFAHKVESILMHEIESGALRGVYFGMQPRKENLLNKASKENNILGIFNVILDIDYFHAPEDNERLERFGLTDKMRFELLDLANTAVSAFKTAGVSPVYALITGRGVQIAFRLEKPLTGELATTESLRFIALKLEEVLHKDEEFHRKFGQVGLDHNAIKLAQIVRFPLTPNGATKRFVPTEFAFVADDLEKAVIPEAFVVDALEVMKHASAIGRAKGAEVEVQVKSRPVKLSEFKLNLSDEHKRRIAEIFAGLYEKGTHNDLALALAGFLAWRRVSVQDALETVNLFLNITGDSENTSIVEKELDGVLLKGGQRAVEKIYYTYLRALSGEKVAWKTLLKDVLRSKAMREASSCDEVDDLVSKQLTQVIMQLNRAFPLRRSKFHRKEKDDPSELELDYDNLTDNEKEVFEIFLEFINLLVEFLSVRKKERNKKAIEIAEFSFNLFDRVQENLVRAVIYVKHTVNGTSRRYSLEVLDKNLNVHEITLNSLDKPMLLLTAIGNVRREYLIPPDSWIQDQLARALRFKNLEHAMIINPKLYLGLNSLFHNVTEAKLTRELEKFEHALRDSWEIVRIQTDEELAEEILYSILSDARVLIVKSDEVYYQDWVYVTNRGELLIPASLIEERLSLNKVSGKAFVSALRKRKLFINNAPGKYRTTRKVKMLEELLRDFKGDVNFDSSIVAQETFYRLSANAVFDFISEVFNEDVRKRIISIEEALNSLKLFELKEKLREAIEQQTSEAEETPAVLEIQAGGGEPR